MSLVPNWLIGKYVTSIAAIPQTVGADGTLTPGSSQPLTGLLDEIGLEQYNDTENIVPMDIRQDNELIIGSGARLTLTEILSRTSGTGFNVLSQIGNANDYVSITFTRATRPFVGIFVIKSYSEALRRGKSTGTMTLGPSGIAATD